MREASESHHGHADPSPAVLGEYRGKWIAVLRGNVVASAGRAIEVLRVVDRDFPGERPVVYRVPAGEVMLL